MPFVIPDVIDPKSGNIVGMVDYLLARLLHVAPAILTARFNDPEKEVVWYLTTDSTPLEFHRIKAIYLRTFLAHFGNHFMGGKVYGGEAEQELSYLGRCFLVGFKMANSQQNGYWIEITAKPKGYNGTGLLSVPV